MLKKSRMTILLALNAIAILVAGVLISNAIWGTAGQVHVVDEKTDVVENEVAAEGLPDKNEVSTISAGAVSSGGISGDQVARGELWKETAITMYQTADFDICVGGGLSNLGDMYWQTSNTEVISGFYATARTWLGYNSETCKYPIIKGTGTTTVTAGTYDGLRRDTIQVTVMAPPEEQWKREVLSLVNKERSKAGLKELSWGATCEDAAATRAKELVSAYSHTRPDGTSWSTACPLPSTGGQSGENLAAGNGAVSPMTVVAMWMNSDTHKANILNPDFTKMAVGFYFDQNTQYKTYWSEYFSTY